MTASRTRLGDASARTVSVALATNLGVAGVKLVVAVLTRSTAMMAEASHALADSGNQVLLVVAQRRSRRAADEDHPLGYGREAYFWAFIAAVVVFAAGALFSLREGIAELIDPVRGTSFVALYAVLIVSAALDSVSLVRAVRQLRREARELQREFLDQVMLTSDPTIRAVFAEDTAAIAGDVIALLGVVLHQTTGSSAWEGAAAVVIGLLLIGVGAQLARRNHDFLLGEQAPLAIKADIRAFVESQPGVAAIRELLVSFVGPRQVWVLVHLEVHDQLRGAEVVGLLRDIDMRLRSRSEYITRVDVVPVAAESAADWARRHRLESGDAASGSARSPCDEGEPTDVGA